MLQKNIAFTVAFSFAATAAVHAAVIVNYDGSSPQPILENFVDGGDITAGTDATVSVPNTGGFGSASDPVINLNPGAGSSNPVVALDNGRLFFFDLTVLPGVTDLDLSGLTLDAAKNGNSARAFGAGFQVDTGSGFGSRVDFVTNQNLGSQNRTSYGPYNLSTQSSLQDLEAGNVVRFLFSNDNDFSASFDNIVLRGEGVFIPEPASAGLALAGLGGLLMRRRK